MEYISWQCLKGGMGRVVHILATKLTSSLSGITLEKYDEEGAGSGGGLSWMAPVRPVGPHAHAPECVPLTHYLARAYILGPDESKPKTSVPSHSEWHPGCFCHSAGSLDHNTTCISLASMVAEK